MESRRKCGIPAASSAFCLNAGKNKYVDDHYFCAEWLKKHF